MNTTAIAGAPRVFGATDNPATGDRDTRYSVTFTNGEASYSGAQRFDTISEVLDYAQETGLTAGMEAIITDHEGSRPTLAVRIIP